MSPLGIVVLIVLIDLLGFSVVMPLLAPFAEQYGFSELQIGLLFSAYPLCQLIAGPILGRLSDRFGRRPLLIFSQAGTALSFLILGLSSQFPIMLLARMLDGASGGTSWWPRPTWPTSPRRSTDPEGWGSSAWPSVWASCSGRCWAAS